MGKTYQQGEVLTALDLNSSLSEAVNVDGYFVFTANPAADTYPFMSGEHVHNAKLTANATFIVNTNPSYFLSNSYFYNPVKISNNVTITNNTTISGHITDHLGDVRGVYRDAPVSANYYLQSSDNGKFIYATGDVYLPPNIFNMGDNITIFNGTDSTIHVRQVSGVALYLAGLGIVGDGFLDSRGLCTILCVDINTFVISSTSNAPVTSSGGGGGSATVDYASVINALGYIPYNAINPNGYITAAQAASLSSGLGIGQTYSLINSPNGTYTNTTGKPIFVAVMGGQPDSGNPDRGALASSAYIRVQYAGGNGAKTTIGMPVNQTGTSFACAVIPNGMSYDVYCNQNYGTLVILS